MTTIPAYTIGGITRPELFLDPNGNIILTPAAQVFADQYGLKALYLGLPPSTPWPPVFGFLMSTPVDTNPAANTNNKNVECLQNGNQSGAWTNISALRLYV